MEITEFINTQPTERQETLTTIHQTILANDTNVIPAIKPMMGKEMILYEQLNYMKYALASAKNYMSLHCLPMYMNPAIHAKYLPLLPNANFQKGCINFTNMKEFPLEVLTAFIAECSSVNIAEVLENRKNKK